MAKYCKHCGAAIQDGEAHDCPQKPPFLKALSKIWCKTRSFTVKLLKRIGIGEEGGDADYFERNKPIIPDSVHPDANEVVIKQYNLAKLRSRLKCTFAEGRMQITNKRVLFRANGFSPAGKITYQSEFAIDKIEGIEIRKDFRFKLADLLLCFFLSPFLSLVGGLLSALIGGSKTGFLGVLSVCLALVCCIPFFLKPKHYFAKYLSSGVGVGVISSTFINGIKYQNDFAISLAYIVGFVVVCIYLASVFLYCFKPNLRVEIKTSGGSPAVQVRHKYTSLFLWHKMDEYSGFSEVLPWVDSDIAAVEIGAILHDLQALGDIGIERWKATN